MTATHPCFTVRVADHEADTPREQWRLQHAGDTFAVIHAYFRLGEDGQPVRSGDGSYEVHTPLRGSLDTLRQMVTHEGMTVAAETEADGDGTDHVPAHVVMETLLKDR